MLSISKQALLDKSSVLQKSSFFQAASVGRGPVVETHECGRGTSLLLRRWEDRTNE
jgi:hypothetical protein